MIIVLKLMATVAAGLFSGASIYINLVEHPARMECGVAAAVAQLPEGGLMQASLAVAGLLSGTSAWILGRELAWLTRGILLGLVIPFTLIVILPTNRKLLDPTLNKESPEARELLDRWGRYHGVRSVLSFSSFLVFVSALNGSFH